MKKKEDILKDLYVTLAELQSDTVTEGSQLHTYLQTKLEFLYNILEEDVPERFWSQVEEQIAKIGTENGVIRILGLNGRLVIPVSIRRKLDINEGDTVKLVLKDNSFVATKYESIN